MKIHRLKIIDSPSRPLLNGVELFFYDGSNNSANPNCFIGVNGTGKSQVLETLAEIFYYLDKIYGNPNNLSIVIDSPLLFELDYSLTIRKKKYLVEVKQQNIKSKAPEIFITSKGKEVEWFVETMHQFLPTKVVAYTSGDNETLSFPFMDYYDEYADYTAKRAFGTIEGEDYEPRFYLMDYTTNIGVVISNLVYSGSRKLKKLLSTDNLKSLRSFQLIIQTKQTAAPSGGIVLTEDLEKWIGILKAVATCYEYSQKENRHTLDFYNNKATKDALNHFFKKPIEFYTALYKIELLNNLLVEDKYLREIKRKRRSRKALIRNPVVPDKDKVLHYSEIKLRHSSGELINYLSLSDGEHQYMNVFGTVLMIDFENSLFLLDEPETHFNPIWRREFIKMLDEIVKGRKQDFFITSHSPFVVADSKREKVYVFKKDQKGKLHVDQPSNETYGSNFDYILKMAFEMDNTISEKSLEELLKLQKSSSIKNIENSIGKFGESSEKFYVLRRLHELKSSK
ncbi:MAG TPA: restriction system-associated AAA family ATPase [Chitinophagaceae bacterium]|nr:restriction system-associated AAA family ATPase [Chitinophagaceae bacterium]